MSMEFTAAQYYRPLIGSVSAGANPDQGDPYVLAAPEGSQTEFGYYLYHTDHVYADARAVDAYGSDDLRTFKYLGKVLLSNQCYNWAPCVTFNGQEYVMHYSRSTPGQPNCDIGHKLRIATAQQPEGPFVDKGELALPADVEFSIDADVYELPDGKPYLAYCYEIWDEEPAGVGLAEVPLTEDLARPAGVPKALARPQYESQLYEANRSMPWKTGKRDWAAGETVDWYCMEAPVGGITSPGGKKVYLYSCGNWQNDSYAIGALVENEQGELVDLAGENHFVLSSNATAGISAIGHPSLLAGDVLLAHGRFGSDTNRKAFLAPLAWDAHDRPYCPLLNDEVQTKSAKASPQQPE